ncbi:hypothetical protein F4677DRAFT_1691 [Hypoxylon crocopeplum]|nr:hypothetical protein F4677DRAFT_1691 [Hypoxylon crocopeplum]
MTLVFFIRGSRRIFIDIRATMRVYRSIRLLYKFGILIISRGNTMPEPIILVSDTPLFRTMHEQSTRHIKLTNTDTILSYHWFTVGRRDQPPLCSPLIKTSSSLLNKPPADLQLGTSRPLGTTADIFTVRLSFFLTTSFLSMAIPAASVVVVLPHFPHERFPPNPD